MPSTFLKIENALKRANGKSIDPLQSDLTV